MIESELEGCPLVSVIVPCYGVEAFLPRCLKSLTDQDYENLEIICINDGSPDDCLGIIRGWRERFPGIIRLIDKKNEGLGAARWDGVAAASGDYIAFLDSDDCASQGFIGKMVSSALENDSDLVVCGFARIDEATGEAIAKDMCAERETFSIRQDPGRLVEINPAPWNKLFRASSLKALPRFETPKPIEDIMISWPAYALMDGVVSFVGEPLVNYTVRPGSQINSVTKEQVDNAKLAFGALAEYYREKRVSNGMMDALKATMFVHLIVSLSSRLSQLPLTELSSCISESARFLDEAFPGWKSTDCMKLGYAMLKRGNYLKIWFAKIIYGLGLLPLSLKVYSILASRLKRDVKW